MQSVGNQGSPSRSGTASYGNSSLLFSSLPSSLVAARLTVLPIIPERGSYSSSTPIAAIVLAGKTGSGKSSLIKLLGGRDLLGAEPLVDAGLDSCTFRKTPPPP